MSDAERAIREKYLSDTNPTTPRYGPDVAYVQLPHTRHPRPYASMGQGNNPIRPWLFPPGMPSTPPLVRSTPSTPTESTQLYRLPQTHAGNTAVAAAAAAAAHQRQMYDLNMSHSAGNTVSNSAQKHLIHESATSINPVIPSALNNRPHISSTDNTFSGRYQHSAPSSSFSLDHPPTFLSKYSPPQKHRRLRSPNFGLPPKEEHPLAYYGSNESKEPYRDSPLAETQQHPSQFNIFSQYKDHRYKEEMSRATTSSHGLPDDSRNLPDRSLRRSLPPPAIPIFPHKSIVHEQIKSTFSGNSRDEEVFTSPSPLRQNSSSPSSLPNTFQTMPPPTSIHSSLADSHISPNFRSSKSSSSSQHYCDQSKSQNNTNLKVPVSSSFVRKRHHSDERNEKNHEMNVPVSLDGISNPYSKCLIGKETDNPTSTNLVNTQPEDDMDNKGANEPIDKSDSYHNLNAESQHSPPWRDEEKLSSTEEEHERETSRSEGTSPIDQQQDEEKPKEQDSSDYPTHFTAGSLIQLSNGTLRPVEDLNTDDFIKSAELSNEVQIDQSVVVSITPSKHKGSVMLGFSVGKEEVQVAVEAAIEHPFYVFGQGWSSVSPKGTMSRYQLSCKELKLGDLCISLTHRDSKSSSPNIVEKHIKQETSSPPIAQMPKLQPINFIQDDRNCESSNTISVERLGHHSGDENDDKMFSSPSSSKRSMGSPLTAREPYGTISTISSLKLLSSLSGRGNDKGSLNTNEDKIMKPPPPPDNIECVKRRRSTSLSPSLTRNKSPEIVNTFSLAQNMKERQVVFSDNVISHSPPLSPVSDDNAQMDDECRFQEQEDDQKLIRRKNLYREPPDSRNRETLPHNISTVSEISSNGHRNKVSPSSDKRTGKSSSEKSNSPTLQYKNKEESVQTSKIFKSGSSTYSQNSQVDASSINTSSIRDDSRASGYQNNVIKEQEDVIKSRIEQEDNERIRESRACIDVKRFTQRFTTQKISSPDNQSDEDESDPYNFTLPHSKDRNAKNADINLASGGQGDVYEEDSDECKADDRINSRKKNMVRPT